MVREGIADRGYLPEGTLVPRRQPGALITEANALVARVVRLATTGKLEAVEGTLLRPEGDSVVYLISDLILHSLFAADYKVLEVLDHVVGILRCWVEATGSGAWRSNAELSMWI